MPEFPKKMTKGEKSVAIYLNDLKIKWKYENPVVVVDGKELSRTWYPDFFLPDFGVYIEVCGLERKKDYDYRERVYNKNNVICIFVHTYKDVGIWEHYLKARLREIQEDRQGILKNFISFAKQEDTKPEEKPKEIKKEVKRNLNQKNKLEENHLNLWIFIKQKEFIKKRYLK